MYIGMTQSLFVKILSIECSFRKIQNKMFPATIDIMPDGICKNLNLKQKLMGYFLYFSFMKRIDEENTRETALAIISG
jgi:hypothetical protein